MKVLVLGSGLIGTASAWYLARAGHEVIVVDRQAEAGLETSFANGGQISVSHSQPWANPEAPLQIMRWLGHGDAPLLFRPRLDLDQWIWGARFLLECLPSRSRHNTEAAFALARYSRECLIQLRQETGIQYDYLSDGILSIYTNRTLFAAAHEEAEFLRSHGLDVTIKTPEECLAIEPALAHAHPVIYGGAYAPSDESGDALKFTQGLAEKARASGVQFNFNLTVTRIETDNGRISGVVVRDAGGDEQRINADAYVAALGSYTPKLVRPLGISLPVYPVKGYSITIPLRDADIAPTVSVTDHERKIVFSRLGSRLRVAGTAELDGFNTRIRQTRIDALIKRTYEFFPKAGRAEEAKPWTGLRPATPSNLPVIGRTRYGNLFLNTGHGTLGWTMACGSGRALADIVGGQRPEPAFPFNLS